MSAWLYQPLASAPRDGFVPVTCGAVWSYLKPSDCWPVLPATSAHVPPTEAFALSGVLYVLGAAHESTPDVASAPAKLTVSAWLYQPFASAPREGSAVTCGLVPSYFRPTDLEAPFPALSLQDPVTEAVAESGPE